MIDWDSPTVATCWYPIPGHANYAVNESGQVLSVRSGATLKPWPNSQGYPVVRIGGRNRLVHKLVALTFCGPCPEGQEARHLDGNRENPSAANLQYGTRAENMADRWQHGTHPALSVTECPQGHPYPPASPGVKRVCAECRPEVKARHVRRQVGVTVECPNCGRSVSKLNLHRHKKSNYCNGRTTGRWL